MTLDTSATPSSDSAVAGSRGPVVDPRGLRFAATLTALVLALVLVTGNGWLLAAQALGLVFAVTGVVGFAFGSTVVGLIATAAALIAAFLNAAFGICLGCELYLLFRRTSTRRASAQHKEGSA